MFKRSIAMVTGVSAVLLCSQIFAAPNTDDDRVYVKVDLGSTTYNAYEGTGTVQSESKVGDLFALGVGLEISPIFAFELTHNEFGKQEGQIDNGGLESFENKVSSNALSVIPTLPIGKKTQFFVELGEHVWEAESKQGAIKNNTDGSDFFYGFGLNYEVKSNLRTGFEFSHYDIASEDFKTVNVTLAYIF